MRQKGNQGQLGRKSELQMPTPPALGPNVLLGPFGAVHYGGKKSKHTHMYVHQNQERAAPLSPVQTKN